MSYKDRWSRKRALLLRILANALALLLALNPVIVHAGNIVTNGKTKTIVDIRGNLTSIRTSTVSGNSGFNSFSQFDVNKAETVNLFLPDKTKNLINLVYDKRSDINGVVNSIKNGAIGGNLYFANPYGLIVGEKGAINTGSLSLTSPSHSFMQSMFDELGKPAQNVVSNLLAGEVPLSNSGLISVKGKINAINDISLSAANIEHSGIAVTGANFQSSAVDFSDLVNVNGIESAGSMAINNGVIEIFAGQQLTVDGQLHADGGNGIDAGAVYLNSEGNIKLGSNAAVSARGKSTDSSGGKIVSMAQDTALLAAGAELDAAAGSSGDGGFIEFSAVKKVSLQGGSFDAGSSEGRAGLVYIDPETIDINGLNVLNGESDLLIEATDTVNVLSGAIVSSRNIANLSDGDHINDSSIADSGDITILAPNINIGENVNILANEIGGTFQAGDVLITNLRPIDVDSVDPTNLELGGFSLADILGNGSDLQGLIDDLGLDVKDVSRLLNDDSDVNFNIGVTGGEQTVIRGNSVDIHAYGSDRFGFEKNAKANVSLINTSIEASDVNILAESDTGLFPKLFDNTVDIEQFSIDPNDLVANFIGPLDLPDSAFYVATTSEASTLIGGEQTTIDAANSLDVSAKSVNKANPFSTGKIVGLEVVDATTNATVEINDQAALRANNLNLNAGASTSTTANANASKLAIPAVAAVAFNKINAKAMVTAGADVTLSANDIELKANSSSSASTTSTATSPSGSSLVAAIAISDVNSQAVTTADGTITANNLNVLAEVESQGNTTKASGGSKGTQGIGDKFNNLTNATSALLATSLTPISDGVADKFFKQTGEGTFNIAGAVAYAKADNQATASLAENAHAEIADTATIKASIVDDIKIGADVAASSGKGAKFTAGGALTIGNYNNSAEAYVDSNANLSAKDVTVDSSSTLDYPWDFDYTDLGELYDKLSGGFADLFITGSAINSMNSKGAGASASVNVIDYTANAKSYLADGATINVIGDGGLVNIEATTDTSLLTVAGKKPNSSAKDAIGGSADVITIGGNTLAYIEDNATVMTVDPIAAIDLNVNAEANINTINIAEAGGSADRVSINGAVSYLGVNQTTSSFIETNASVSADSVSVEADTNVALWTIAGGFAKSEAVGIGLSVALNDIDIKTRSYIGNASDTGGAIPAGASVTSNQTSITAHADGVMDAIAIAGALVSNSDESSSNPLSKVSEAKSKVGNLLDQATATVNAQRDNASSASSGDAADGSRASSGGASGTPEGEADESSPKPSFGIGISGAASVNQVAFVTEAKLQKARVATKELAITAINEVDIDAGSGSASFTKAKAKSSKNSAAIAGAFAFNDIENTTNAKISSAGVDNAKAVAVRALSAGEQLAIGIGMAVNASGKNSGKSASVAGSVSLSNTRNTTEALIEESVITGDSSDDSQIDIVAYDKTNLGVGGGSLFFGGKSGFGAAVSLSEISNTVTSQVTGSTISEFDSLSQRSLNAATIGAGAATAGGGSGTNSLAGSFVFSEIDNTTSATMSSGSTVTVADSLQLLASDSGGDSNLDSLFTNAASEYDYDYDGSDAGAADADGNSIVAVAGLVQVGKNNIGVSVVKTDINNKVTTAIDDSTITASVIDADAKANAAITAVAIGVGGGTGKLAANGSVALGAIANETAASSNNSDLTANSISIDAADESAIASLAGTVALSAKSTALGASVSVSNIANTTSASLQDGSVNTAGDIRVNAASDAIIETIAVAGGAGKKVAVGISVTVNEISNATDATLSGTAFEQSAANLELAANDNSTIKSLAGSLNGAGKVAVGAAVAINMMENQVKARLNDLTNLAVTNTVNVDASNDSTIEAIAVAGGAAGKVAFNGSATVNLMANTTEAKVTNVESEIKAAVISVNASDDSSIQSLAGAVGGAGKGAVGAAVAVNDLANTVSSHISQSRLRAASITSNGNTAASIESIAVAGSGAGTFTVNGSVAVNFINNTTESLVDELAYSEPGETLTVSASDDSDIDSLGGSVGVAGTAAIGAAATINEVSNTVMADVANSAINVDSMTVNARSRANILTLAVAGGGSGTAAIGGSAAANKIANQINASIRNIEQTNSGLNIEVVAADNSIIESLAGSVQIGGTAAIGAAVAVNEISNALTAEIEDSSIDVSGSLSVDARSDTKIKTLAVAGGGGGTAAVGGSAATNKIANNIKASVRDSEQASTAANVEVVASDNSTIESLAGSVQIGGTAAIGAAVAINEISNALTAEIEDSSIDVSDSLSVDAHSDAEIKTLAVAGGGGGTAAIGGSAATNKIANNITASVRDSEQANTAANVEVVASDNSTIESLAGSVQIGGTAAIGAAVAVNRIDNQIGSWISGAGSTIAGNNIVVDSSSDATIKTAAVGASVSGTVGVAGSVAVNLMNNAVDAHIDDGAEVIGQHNVAVRADSSDDIDVLAGAVAIGAGGAGLGATVSVNQIDSSTNAYISGAGTKVSAQANSSDGLGLSNGIGDFNFGKVIDSQAKQAKNGADDEDGDGSSDTTYNKLDLASKINAETDNTGVTINATSRQNIDTLGATAGIGLYAGLGATANVNVIGGETKAYIDDGASINQQAGANDRQNLAVVAEDHTYTNAFVGAIGGGAVGLGAAVDASVIDRSTQAYIIDAGRTKAKSDLVVKATASQGANSIAVGGAGGGVALAASGTVLKFDADTKAYIENTGVVDAGSVTVAAKADNQSAFYDFAAAGGAVLAGSGTFGVNLVNNRTTAHIKGASDTPLVLRSAGAVRVAAESSTRNETTAISFAAAGGVGVAGMAAVNIITSNTEAKVDNVRAGSSDAPLDSLRITATDGIRLYGLAGAIGGGGAAGIGAGATVNIIKSRVIADINDSTADVAGEVTVAADSSKLANNVTATAGAGLTLGVGGSAQVNLFGAELEGDSAEELDKDDDGTLTKVNDLAGGSKTELLEGQGEDTISSAEIAALDAKTQSDVKTVATTQSVGANAYRTGAAIRGNSTIKSGSVNVRAADATTASAEVGGVAIGTVGVGGAFALTEVNNTITADITESVSVEAENLTLNASAGNGAGQDHTIETDVFAGAAGLVGIGAAVAIANIDNTVTANLASAVTGNTAVDVKATDSSSILVDAKGAAAGAGAVGVVVANSYKNSNVTATVGGSKPITTISSLAISAENSGRVEALSKAGAAGLFAAGTGADARATDTSSVTASTADGSAFDDMGTMSLSASTTPDVYANSTGVSVAGGVKIGASFAKALSQQSVVAALGADNQVMADVLSLTASNALSAPAGYSASANALGAGGGLLLGLNATDGIAVNTINVQSYIGSGSTLGIGSALNVIAENASRQHADVTGINGGIIAAGFNQSESITTSNVQAFVGDDVDISGGNASITADSKNENYADSVSGSGGVVSGSASEANTLMGSNTRAYIGDNTAANDIAVDSLVINAKHRSVFNAKVDSSNASLAGASGATASNKSNSTVGADLGKGLDVEATAVDIDAINIVDKTMDGWNVISGSGGLIDLPAASSKTSMSNNTAVNIGENTVLTQTGSRFNPGTFEIDAFNQVTAKDKVKMNAGGAIALAKGVSTINAVENNTAVNVDQGAVVKAVGDLNMGARAVANIATTVAVDVFGLAGVPFGDATSNFAAANTININKNAELLSLRDIRLGAGIDSQGNDNDISVTARSDLWNKSAFPLLHDPVADAFVATTNNINIGTGADIAAVRDIVLTATEGDIAASGKGVGKDIYSEVLSAIVNGIGGIFGAEEVSFDRNGGSSTEKSSSIVTIAQQAEVRVGIEARQKLEISFSDIDPSRQSLTAIKTVNDVVVSGDKGIQFTDGGTFSLTDDIRGRITELQELIAEYSVGDDGNTGELAIAILAYENEIDYLNQKLEDLGYVDGGVEDSNFKFTGATTETELELKQREVTQISALRAVIVDERDTVAGERDSAQAKYEELATELITLNTETSTLNSKLTTLNTELTALNTELNGLDPVDDKAAYDAKNLEIGMKNDAISAKQDEITANTAAIATNKESYNDELDIYTEKSAAVLALNTDIGEYDNRINPIQTKINDGAYSNEPDPGIRVSKLIIADTVAQLGNIIIEADRLQGSGVLQSPGDAKIEIVNKTNSFLELNDLIIPANDGGHIYFNDVDITTVDNVMAVNRSFSGAAGPVSLTIDSSVGDAAPEISITSTYTPLSQSNKDFVENNEGYANIGPDIIVKEGGLISNTRGLVKIDSEAGNIRIEPDSKISAATVEIETRSGDFVQSYSDAFSHIAGDPLLPNGSGLNKTFVENGSQGADSAGIIANGSVLIAARYLNINGLIQSGIPEWGVSIAANAGAINPVTESQMTFAQAIAHYETLDSPAEGAEFYQVHGTSTTGLGDEYREIGVEFNALTKRLELNGVEVKGGYIDLFGQIMNTGNKNTGKLKVLDGYGQIKVNNQSDQNLYLSTLDAGQGVEGKIKISNITGIDDGSPVIDVQEFTRGNGDRTGYTYNPAAGLRYVQSVGVDKTTTNYYKYEEKDLFGVDAFTINTDLSKFKIDFKESEDVLTTGEFLSTGIPGNEHFISKTETYETVDADGKPTSRRVLGRNGKYGSDCLGSLCFSTTYYQFFNDIEGEKEVTSYSMRADYGIDMEYIGHDEGLIDIASKQDVLLAGSLINRNGNTQVTSSQGNIFQIEKNVAVGGIDIEFAAAESIGSAEQSIVIDNLLDDGIFNAKADSGDIYVKQRTGDMNIGVVSASNGKVNLDVDNTISTVDSGYIAGQRVELTSRNGAIGDASNPVNIRTGVTNVIAEFVNYGLAATAREDIHIKNTGGDLMVTSVESLSGDVTLETDGTMIDNNQIQRSDTRAIDELVALWDDMQLRGDSASAKEEQTIERFESSVTADYRSYWNTRLSQDDPSQYDSSYVARLSADQETVMRAQFALRDADGNGTNNNPSEIDAEIDRYIKERTSDYHAQHARLYDPASENAVKGTVAGEFVEDFRYEATATEGNSRIEGASWSDFQLALSVSPGLLKGVSDTVTVIEEPNVTGKNVTLISSGGDIGTINPVSFDLNKDNPLDFSAEEKAALAAAERGDITVLSDSLVISKREDADVELRAGGNLTAQAETGDIFLGSEGDVAVNQISAGDEIRLKVAGNLINDNTNSSIANVVGGRTILEAANGVIGSIDKALFVNLSTNAPLTARADGDIFIQEAADNLNVDTMFSRGQINLAADGSIIDAFDDGEVNISANGITLVTDENVGEEDDALDIVLANGSQVDINAAGNVNINGERTRLNVGKINASNLKIQLGVAGGSLTNAIGVTGSSSIDGAGRWEMLADSSSQSAVSTVDIAGDLLMNANTSIEANQISVNSGGKIVLNDLNSGDVIAINASSDVKLAESAQLDANGNLQINTNGALTMSEAASLTAGGMTLNSNGAMSLNDLTASESMLLDAGADVRVSASSEVTAGAGLQINTDGELVMADAANMTAGEMTLVSNGAMRINDLTASEAILLDAGNDVRLSAFSQISAGAAVNINAGSDLLMAAGSSLTGAGVTQINVAGDISVANIASLSSSAEAVKLVAGQQITDADDINTDIVALQGGLSMVAGAGIGINNALEVNVKIGSVTTDQGDIILTSDTNLKLNARAENGSILAIAGETLTTDSGIYASDKVTLIADEKIQIESLAVGSGVDLTSKIIEVSVTQNPVETSPIRFDVSGFGGQSQDVQLKIDTDNAVVFDRLWSESANIAITSNEVSVRNGLTDKQVSVTTPLTALQVDNKSVVRKEGLDLQLYDKEKAFSFDLNDGRLSSQDNVLLGNSDTHSVDSPLGQDKSLTRYLQDILQLVKSDAGLSNGSKSGAQNSDDEQDNAPPLIDFSEDFNQVIRLDPPTQNEKYKANNKARSDELAEIRVSAVY